MPTPPKGVSDEWIMQVLGCILNTIVASRTGMNPVWLDNRVIVRLLQENAEQYAKEYAIYLDEMRKEVSKVDYNKFYEDWKENNGSQGN